MTLWEIAKLVEKERITLTGSLDSWFRSLEDDPLIEIIPLSPEVILESTRLGERFPSDPADQLISATARVRSLRLLTQDKRIRDSGAVLVA